MQKNNLTQNFAQAKLDNSTTRQLDNSTTRQQGRSSSFELLRIISMFLIVMHHYSIHGGFVLTSYFSLNVYFVQCLQMFGKLGVNLFVLISGYFLCTSKFNWKKLLKLELQVLFYSVLISVLFYIFLPEKIDLLSFIKTCFPLFTYQYWFYSVYFVLVLLSPFINVFINACSKEKMQKLILMLTILWVIFPFFLGLCRFIPIIWFLPPYLVTLEFSSLGWFIFLYIVASYIKIYGEEIKLKTSVIGAVAVASFVLILLSVLFFDLLGLWKIVFQKYFPFLLAENSLLIFICSVFTFFYFSKIKMKQSKLINLISSATFAVYLIHDNNFVRALLWCDLLKNAEFLDTPSIYLHAIISIFAVYVICTLIDLLRQYVSKKIKKLPLKSPRISCTLK